MRSPLPSFASRNQIGAQNVSIRMRSHIGPEVKVLDMTRANGEARARLQTPLENVMRLPITFSFAILAATAGCAFLSFATPAAAAPLSAATAPNASESAVEFCRLQALAPGSLL